jgi:hypothetical protein
MPSLLFYFFRNESSIGVKPYEDPEKRKKPGVSDCIQRENHVRKRIRKLSGTYVKITINYIENISIKEVRIIC